MQKRKKKNTIQALVLEDERIVKSLSMIVILTFFGPKKGVSSIFWGLRIGTRINSSYLEVWVIAKEILRQG